YDRARTAVWAGQVRGNVQLIAGSRGPNEQRVRGHDGQNRHGPALDVRVELLADLVGFRGLGHHTSLNLVQAGGPPAALGVEHEVARRLRCGLGGVLVGGHDHNGSVLRGDRLPPVDDVLLTRPEQDQGSVVRHTRRNHVVLGPEREYLNGVRVVYREHARAPPVQVVARPGHEQDGTRRYQQPVLDHAHVGDLLPEQEGHRAGDEVPDSRRAESWGLHSTGVLQVLGSASHMEDIILYC